MAGLRSSCSVIPPPWVVTVTRAEPMRQCFYRIGAMARMCSVARALQGHHHTIVRWESLCAFSQPLNHPSNLAAPLA